MNSSSSSSSLFQRVTPSGFQDKQHYNHHSKRERCLHIGRLTPFLLYSLVVITIFTFFVYFPNSLKITPRPLIHRDDRRDSIHGDDYILNCDLFKGHWKPDLEASQYTNSSCSTIPKSKNCFFQGRKDRDFLNWRWKPDGCDLPRFNPKTFLDMVRGNKMAFIGDSVARNQMDSLLCLLSQESTPKHVYQDTDDRNRIWHFPDHDFTLMILWTKFLVFGEERVANGSKIGIFDLQLDRVDNNWALNIPAIDYAIISSGHWFFRPIYLHDGANTVGCVYCNEPNVTNLGVGGALRLAIRAALDNINRCQDCRGVVAVLRTFSPSHFENGYWNTGGSCRRTSPFSDRDVELEGMDWELRNIQVEEIEKARREGEKHGKSFVTMDVTRAMLLRPDGHPGDYWGNKWMKGFSDCVHWCLPGPIDMWNEFLMAILEKETGLVS